MPVPYTFLPDNDLSFDTVWKWAKRLVQDLNGRDNQLAGPSNGLPVGVTMLWHEATPPLGWLLANGQALTKGAYPALFALYGYRYGGSGDSFQLPDYRDRIPIGAGNLVALNKQLGADKITLAVANLAAHHHPVADPGHTHLFDGIAHTHVVTDPQHAHVLNDPLHAHTINDPQHTHPNGVIATTSNAAAGANPAIATSTTGPASTGIVINPAVTGITMNIAPTGITNQNTVAAGTNRNATTGVTTTDTGTGDAFSVLNPVFGVNIIVKY